MTLPQDIAGQERSDGAAELPLDRSSIPGGRRLAARLKGSIKSFLYFFYERRLERQLRAGAMPRHVGIILDGNRRFGRRQRIDDPRELYALGAGKLHQVLEWCTAMRIPAVTLWVCSTSNLNRPAEEVTGILAAIQEKMAELADDPFVRQHQVRVRAAGRLELLPPSTRTAIEAAEEATKEHAALVLTIAVAYDGREELVDALRSILRARTADTQDPAAAIEEISVETIRRHLYAPDLPDPDLVIRTSGELRLSGFLLWQSAYSEFYFSDIDWPAFRKIDFLRAVRAYQHRQRRFGL